MEDQTLKDFAYAMMQQLQCRIELDAMLAANNQYSEDQPYSEHDIKALIEKHGIHHNALLGLWQR